MVFVVPNCSLVKAKIIQKSNIKRNNDLLVKLQIIESYDLDDLPNFTKNQIGKTINVIFPDIDDIKLISDNIASFKIQYVGDERGGKFIGVV